MAKKGGNVAKAARLQLEETTGKKVVSNLSAKKIMENKNKLLNDK